jgi:long-subunit acyl-CoA synthetase (AMP-forming)
VPELLKAWTMLLAHTERQAPETLRFVAVGGARVAHELLSATRQRGIPAHQGYGLTECGSVVTLNRPDDDTGSGDDVGRPLDHARVRVDGNEVMVGTGRPSRLRRGAVGTDGEFPTGDLGELDQRGHLRLTGRCKNLLITSYGRNISPEWVEAALLAQPAILQAIVVGDGRPAPAAIIVAAPGTHETDVDAAILAANQTLPDYARVAHRLLAAPFTPENGLATGNGRPMRSAIIEHHAAQVAALYAQEESEDVVL